MSKAKRRQPPSAELSSELILAAVDRAVRHRPRGREAAPIWEILAHLGVPRRSAAARAVRARLASLCHEGALESAREHGVELWAIAPAGRARLRGAPSLPESPQHAAWRAARTAAAQEIERFHTRLARRLNEALTLLDAKPAGSSDAWLELGEGLQRDCWLLASASHCLHEWAEPDDALADIETDADDQRSQRTREDATLARRRSRRAGLRNIGLWRERADSAGSSAAS